MTGKHFLARICPILTKYCAYEEKFQFSKNMRRKGIRSVLLKVETLPMTSKGYSIL